MARGRFIPKVHSIAGRVPSTKTLPNCPADKSVMDRFDIPKPPEMFRLTPHG
jgi:hypothetical protein